MDSKRWRAYFESNRAREAATLPPGYRPTVDARLRAPLIHTLQRLHLGERGEGRIVLEAYRSDDPCLDDDVRRSIDLYVAEEHRHAVEVASVIGALGGRPLESHWSERLFCRGRRLLGLRTKMMTIAAAEVVGVEVYRLIARHAGDPRIAAIANRIATEEAAHLRFQSEWIRRVLDGSPARGHRLGVGAGYAVVQASAVAVFCADHRPLLGAIGVRRGELARSCMVRSAATLGRAIATWQRADAREPRREQRARG